MLNVLIAEDDADLQSIFARMFEISGHTVWLSSDGAETWQLLQDVHPDVLILDLNMPIMSGLEILTRMEAHRMLGRTAIIVVTGNQIAARSREAELADLILVKPVGAVELVTLAERYVVARQR
jgi:CheY-like chemotaxis protein